MFHTGCQLHSNWCVSWVVFLELQPAVLIGRLDLTPGAEWLGAGEEGEECTDFLNIYTKHTHLKTVTPLTTEHACFKQQTLAFFQDRFCLVKGCLLSGIHEAFDKNPLQPLYCHNFCQAQH